MLLFQFKTPFFIFVRMFWGKPKMAYSCLNLRFGKSHSTTCHNTRLHSGILDFWSICICPIGSHNSSWLKGCLGHFLAQAQKIKESILKKLSYIFSKVFLIFWEMALSKLKKWNNPTLKKCLIFQEMKLSCPKLKKFQKGTSRAWKTKLSLKTLSHLLRLLLMKLKNKKFTTQDDCWSSRKIRKSQGWLLIKHIMKNSS